MTYVTPEVKKMVSNRIAKCIEDTSRLFGVNVKMPRITYTLSGTTAGTATYNAWTIDLNPTLLMENLDTFVDRTPVHEFAHLIDHMINPQNHERGLTRTRTGRLKRAKRDIHGPDWQRIDIALGGDGSRCHTYDVSSVQRKKATHTWVCQDCGTEMELGPKRHKTMLTNNKAYRLRNSGCSFDHEYVLKGKNAPVRPTPLPKAADAPKPKATKKSTGTSKIDICRGLFDSTLSRKDQLKLFVEKAGCSPACAATYYQTIRNS